MQERLEREKANKWKKYYMHLLLFCCSLRLHHKSLEEEENNITLD